MHDVELLQRYRAALRSEDRDDRAVAKELLRRLARASNRRTGGMGQDERPTARWAHVDSVELLSQLGASNIEQRGGRIQSGHDWAHGSRSGACLVLWPTEGRWWCSSCRRGGDLLALVRDALGLGHDAAWTWLAARYRPPAIGRPSGRRARRGYNPTARVVRLEGAADA
jgi:hypothetical protein